MIEEMIDNAMKLLGAVVVLGLILGIGFCWLGVVFYSAVQIAWATNMQTLYGYTLLLAGIFIVLLCVVSYLLIARVRHYYKMKERENPLCEVIPK